MARWLRNSGEDEDAIRLLNAGEDERLSAIRSAGAILGEFLKWTIGYGHPPMPTVFWMLGVVAMGWVTVPIGARGSAAPDLAGEPPRHGEDHLPETASFL
jgi:hypothetical protein